MKLVMWETAGSPPAVGLLTDRGVVSLADIGGPTASPQAAMESVIDQFESLRERLVHMASQADAMPLDRVHLLPPLPWPGKILCSAARYGAAGEAVPQLLTLKSAESVVGPGGAVVLPAVGAEWQFVPEAELGLVLRGPAKQLKAADWASAVFGYTCVFDVMARGDQQLGRDYWLAKADTLSPIGPCIVTADEIADPNALRIRSFQNGQPRQDFSTGDADYRVPELIEFATSVMTLYTGDVFACGTSPTGLQPIADGDELELDIDGVGKLGVHVRAMAGSRV